MHAAAAPPWRLSQQNGDLVVQRDPNRLAAGRAAVYIANGNDPECPDWPIENATD